MTHDDLRVKIGRALLALGAAGYRDTTDVRRRPKWRASFSFHGQMQGETRYLQLFVPVDADVVQVNCTVEAPALDAMSKRQLQDSLEEMVVEYAPGARQWERMLADLGVDPHDVDGWDTTTALHTGMYHQMLLVRVTMHLEDLCDESLELATRVGYRLAQDARASLTDRG